jgi:nucleotide-binding universal stress UspA family protein
MRWGHPAEEILKVAEEEKAEIIVMGSRGRRRGILLGSVSKEVVERAKVCVMVAR